MNTSAAFVPGHAEPGGPSIAWDLGVVQIRKASVSEQDNNAYLLTETSSGAHLLIDAADDADRLCALLAEPGPAGEVAAIVTTHQHWDHHRALPALVEHTGAPALAGADDAAALPVPVHRHLRHGDRVRLGAQHLDVIGLRGHTPGSVALAWTDTSSGVVHLFTGDSLFPGGVGRTTSEEDFDSLLTDVQTRIFDVYDDDAVVHPGHGDNTTLGAERPELDHWRERRW
ncbi:MBL fold metallo-hydrolase [Pseudactinotalea sp. Z1748]|uniref:MBL fold metallo-hydrolase n=1 Tax=Pseudactinotalea sp. Z1748 TaxID=3413027 RepID=UPI003C7C3AC4